MKTLEPNKIAAIDRIILAARAFQIMLVAVAVLYAVFAVCAMIGGAA